MINSNAVEAEIELRNRLKTGKGLKAPDDWRDWLRELFPKHFSKPFAQRHVEFWEWIESIVPNVKPKAFIGIWGRGGAKSTNAETAVIRLGSKKVRKYGWYISSTQDKANQHVENIGAMLESEQYSKFYRKMSRRAVNQYGSSKGWRRSRLHTASGFVVDALGLDTGARGFKVEDARPDFIIIDDVDELHESATVTMKKERILTDTIFPAGSSDCAILFIQNLIHPDSIASKLLDGRADYLRNRILSGAHPAIEGLAYEERPDPEQNNDLKFFITAGQATWEGQSIEICQEQMNDWGISAFLREAQHDVTLTGGMWDHITFMHKTWDEIKDKLVRTEVWVDPAVTETDQSDCQGINCGGLLTNNHLVFMYFYEAIGSPHKTLVRAIEVALQYGAGYVGVETDQGGDTWKSTYQLAAQEVYNKMVEKWKEDNPKKHIDDMPPIHLPKFTSEKAGHGHGNKVERNQRMLTDYEKGLVYHMIGTHTTGEKALRRFSNPPLDLVDSMYYTWYRLIGKKKARLHSA